MEPEKTPNSLEKLAFEKADMASSVTKVEAAIEQLSSELELGKGSLSNQERETIEENLQVLNGQLNEEQERLKKQDAKSE